MMKKYVLLTAVLGFTVFAGEAPAEECNLKYTVKDNSYVVVTGASNNSTCTTAYIPAEYNGLPVKEIGRTAFYYSSVSQVTFEPGIKLETVGDFAFAGSAISEINLPEGVTSVGDVAFNSCVNLTSVNLPNSIESIGTGVFNDAPLNEIKLPANLKKLGNAIHRTNITTIEIPEGMTSLEGAYFWEIPNVILSDSVKEISKSAIYLYYNTVYCANEEQEKLIADYSGGYAAKKLFTYQKNDDETITISQQGRELYKYADKDKMLAGTDWLERYQYSDDKKYGGLRQEAYAKDGDGEKYLGAKIYRPDGSIVLVDENNKFVNKLHAKIYTVEEAMAVTRDGNVNRVRLTYK